MSDKDVKRKMAIAQLNNLAHILLENEQDRHNSAQASPVYYVVLDRRKEFRPTGYGAGTKTLDTSPNEDLGEISDKEYRILEEYGRTEDIEPVAFEWEEFIVKDHMFMTRKEADEWISLNHHHVSLWAHSFAMTALDSPVYSEIVKALFNLVNDAS